jgi:hypothetical protein
VLQGNPEQAAVHYLTFGIREGRAGSATTQGLTHLNLGTCSQLCTLTTNWGIPQPRFSRREITGVKDMQPRGVERRQLSRLLSTVRVESITFSGQISVFQGGRQQLNLQVSFLFQGQRFTWSLDSTVQSISDVAVKLFERIKTI